MKKTLMAIIGLAVLTLRGAEPDGVMSAAYWEKWNAEEQKRVDRDIDQYRKGDAIVKLPGIAAGTEVKVEQISHDFIFGAHIFNFNQLGKDEYNSRYKELYGTLFNSATIAFYWKKFELEDGKPRFKGEYRDSADYWNKSKEPKKETHWRRPASDPVVEFCESKGIRLHGHTICWGNRRWQHPGWLFEKYCPENEKKALLAFGRDKLRAKTPDEIGELAPVYVQEQEKRFDRRMRELADYYKGRVHSWDVVNESATDFGQGRMVPDKPVCSSRYGLMPGDYTYRSFQQADQLFPKNVLLNINDYVVDDRYLKQVADLRSRGCRIDIMGTQMHLFNPKDCQAIADGENVGRIVNSPRQIRDTMAILSRSGLPLHLSEITITAPTDSERGRAIQSVITRNLYRAWFSIKSMMGITWWNVVDDCGAPGEPNTSGLFTRDMRPKPAYHTLNKLIHDEWKTRMTLKADNTGTVKFRGFKGKYRATYKDASGATRRADFHLTKDGVASVAAR